MTRTYTAQLTEMQRKLIIKALESLDADDSSEEYDVECLLAEMEDIVTAVNAHDQLVEVLTEVMGWISNWDPNFIYDVNGLGHDRGLTQLSSWRGARHDQR